MTPTLLGARCDWLGQSFRVALDDRVLRYLRARAAAAKRDQSPASVMIGVRAFMLRPGQVATRWFLQDDVCVLTIDERAPGGEGDAPGWTVGIETSGTGMLTLGYRRAIAEAWKLARCLGDVVQTRFGRVDLCADVAGYGLAETDRRGFIKQRRVKQAQYFRDGTEVTTSGPAKRQTDGTMKRKERTTWQVQLMRTGQADEGSELVSYHAGDTFTGYRIGGGKTVLGRIYAKALELRAQCKDKQSAEHAQWRAAGWDGGDDVARVEFQARGEALDELKLRHLVWGDVGPEAHAEMFAASLDATWAYYTRVWLRLERPGKGELQDRWRIVQSATFEKAAEPTVRVRQRGLAKAAQARGAGMSFLARTGALPPAPYPKRVTRDGEFDVDRLGEDAEDLVQLIVGKVRTPEEGHAKASAALRADFVAIFAAVAEGVTAAELEKWPTGSDALRAHITRRQAMLARCSPALEWYERKAAG